MVELLQRIIVLVFVKNLRLNEVYYRNYFDLLFFFPVESQLSGEDADLSNVEVLIHSIEGMVFALINIEN